MKNEILLISAFMFACGSSPSDQATNIEPTPPATIDEDVKQAFAFTFDLPVGSTMENEGYVNNCPVNLTDCMPEYEFRFSGEIDSVAYDMTVMIDPYDHGGHPQTFIFATENPDGTINVFDNIDDEGSGSWITNATALESSVGHKFLFVVNFNLEDEVVVKRVFRSIMSGFRITY